MKMTTKYQTYDENKIEIKVNKNGNENKIL